MMLTIRDVHAGYPGLKVLKGISMHVAPGEIVAVIGPNGAGKSTIIKSIFGLAERLQGRFIFKEKDISSVRTHELIELGISYVPQGKINFWNLTVEENLRIGVDFLHDKYLIEQQLAFVFKKFPVLRERRRSWAFELSGGQQQMLALGRALMQNPSLLMLDEPSLGLSPKLQKELFVLLKGLKDDGISLLIVEQNAKKAIEIADRTYLLEDGKVVLEGGKDILKHKKIQEVYLGGRF
ncbi:MAG: ABC transporter ATP-binding protein [Nanoarchaeota archaeon]|nr:ABC transporter ATP-binding protein [Nanoarchaeota archaeon]